MMVKEYETKLLSTPFSKQDPYNALSMPVYHTLAYEFQTAEEMEAAFRGLTDEHTYSRITNPTVQYFEERVRKCTGAYGVTALNSGMAAISNTLITLAWSGANLITSNHLFGNTYSFLINTLNALGVEIRFCNLSNPDEVAHAIDEHTCALFLEIITNPQMEVVDLQMLSRVAHEKDVPLIADTTVVPFTVFSAVDFGVDIEVIASTKYISGGATSLGGLIIDYGRFNRYRSPMLKAYDGKSQSSFHARLRKEVHRNLGAYMTPEAAYLQSLGLETLQVRFEKQSATSRQLAKQLQALPEIKAVNYTGLPDNPYYDVSGRQFGNYPGAMLTFDLQSREHCFLCLNNLKLIRRATNLFDNRSLMIHPASTIFGNFTADQRDRMDVRETTLRLSVGLESFESLYEDIRTALV